MGLEQNVLAIECELEKIYHSLAVNMGSCLSFTVDMVKVDQFLIWWISADAQI